MLNSLPCLNTFVNVKKRRLPHEARIEEAGSIGPGGVFLLKTNRGGPYGLVLALFLYLSSAK